MALKEYQLLYLDNDIPINRSFYCNNGDIKSRGLEVHVLDNSQAKDCTGLTLKMIIKVPSGDLFEATVANGLVTVLNATGGIYQVLFPNNMGKGRLIAEIQLSNTVPEVIVSRKFSIVGDGSLTSDGSISVLPTGGLLWNVLTNETQRQADFVEVLGSLDEEVALKYAGLEAEYATDLTDVKSQLAENVPHVKLFGAVGDGVTNDAITLTNANAVNGNIHISKGTFRISANVTVENLYVSNGGKLLIDSGVIVTIGHVHCDLSTQCFTGLGKVVIQDSYYSLAWYQGVSANKKWDFMRRGFANKQGIQKYVHVPMPKVTDEAYTLNSFNIPSWAMDGAITISDPEDDMMFDALATFRAVAGCTEMFVFSPSAKTEEILFPRGLVLEGGTASTPIANSGIVIHGGARIKFMGVTRCKYFKEYGVKQDCSVASCDEVQFDFLECTGFGIAGMLVAGMAGANLYGYVNFFFSNGAFATGQAFIKIEGAVRNFTVNKFIENVVTGGGLTDVTTAQILVSSLSNGVPKNVNIKEIYSAYSTKLMLKTQNNGGSQKIVMLRAEHLHGNASAGVSLSYVMQSIINDVFGIGNVTVASDCSKLSLNNIYIPIVGNCDLLSIDGKLSDISTIATNTVIQVINLPNGVYTIDTDNVANQCVFIISADAITVLNAGSNVNVIASTHLYGTTGIAGKLNISFYIGAYLYIENRTGVSVTTVLKQL